MDENDKEDFTPNESDERECERTLKNGERALQSARADMQNEIGRYLRTQGNPPPLTDQAEFLQLFELWQRTGSRKAERLLISRNTRLVISIALGYRNRGLRLSDLMQEGAIGLRIALDKFDPERGYRFSTYASFWIRQSLQRAFKNQGTTWAFRVPVHFNDLVFSVERSARRYMQAHQAEPDDEQLLQWIRTQDPHIKQARAKARAKAKETGKVLSQAWYDKLTLESLNEARKLLRDKSLSFDKPLTFDDGEASTTFGDTLADATQDTETLLEARALFAKSVKAMELIRRVLDGLNPIEKAVLLERRIATTGNRLTLEEIGQRFELTRERIRQLETRALQHVAEKLRITPEQLEQFIASHNALAELTDNVASDDERDTLIASPSSEVCDLDNVFQILCKHAVHRPDGRQLVSAPVRTLGVRLDLTAQTATLALERLAQEGLINGTAPWTEITIVPRIEPNVFTSRAGTERLLFAKREETAAPDDADLEVFPINDDQSDISTLVEPSTAMDEEGLRLLEERANEVSGQRVVRGPVAILTQRFRIYPVKAERLLLRLKDRQLIEQLDGWRTIRLCQPPLSGVPR